MTLSKRYSKVNYPSNTVRSYLGNINILKESSRLRSNNNQPVAYQKGYVEFYKLKFRVTPDVLIPRPETELLVDSVLNTLRAKREATLETINNSKVGSRPQMADSNNKNITILDLGTGTGNIAISLACNLSGCNVKIIATDISAKALKVARQNAKLHNVEDKITFIKSNLLLNVIARSKDDEAISKIRMPRPFGARNDANIDIIVTNLPYIPTTRIPYLDSSVKDFEPHIALDGGEDGFKLYRELFKQIKSKNWKPQLIIGEIDYAHGELAVSEAQKYFPKAEVEVKKDLARLQRILNINLTSKK